MIAALLDGRPYEVQEDPCPRSDPGLDGARRRPDHTGIRWDGYPATVLGRIRAVPSSPLLVNDTPIASTRMRR